MDEINTEKDSITSGVQSTSDFVANKASERDEKGRYLPGHDIPGPGRPKETEEEKEARRIRKEVEEKTKEEYKNGIINALPQISPALLEKAKGGDVQAIKEIHSLIFGNKTVMVGGDEGENPIVVKQLLVKIIDGESDNNEHTEGISEVI